MLTKQEVVDSAGDIMSWLENACGDMAFERSKGFHLDDKWEKHTQTVFQVLLSMKAQTMLDRTSS